MNNIINIFFQCAHYAVYIYILRILYIKFLRHYLLQEQQQQRAIMEQFQQKLFTAESLMQAFKKQVAYLTALFAKISRQQQQAQELSEKLLQEHARAQTVIQSEYTQQQELIAYRRQLQQILKEFAPEVMQQLRAELVLYSQQHGKEYLHEAIKALKEQAQHASNV